MESTQPKRILTLGGGFAGLSVAMELERKLARDPFVEITLVNRENFFLFTPMLHEVAASDLDLTTIVNPVRKMLRRVHFWAGEKGFSLFGHRAARGDWAKDWRHQHLGHPLLGVHRRVAMADDLPDQAPAIREKAARGFRLDTRSDFFGRPCSIPGHPRAHDFQPRGRAPEPIELGGRASLIHIR